MTEFTRELIYGKRPTKRQNPKPGQSEWYYLDPRGTDRFADMKEIDVESENSPNPYANEIQNYLYENDEYNYNKLYGDTPPRVSVGDQPEVPPLDDANSYTTESCWGYPNNPRSQYYQQMDLPYSLHSEKEYLIGTLSSLMESNNGEKLWNNGKLDKTGGWSYGTYQIATKDGTMNDYLDHLQKNPSYQRYYNALREAGGYNAALEGSEQFKNIWSSLSNDRFFLQSQQDFILEKKLNPTMKYVDDIKGWKLDNRSPVVRDVIFSTAVQHGEGGAESVLHNRFGRNTDISHLSDEDIINNIYDERSDVNHYFRSSSENIRNSLKDRFIKEKYKALELLKKYP